MTLVVFTTLLGGCQKDNWNSERVDSEVIVERFIKMRKEGNLDAAKALACIQEPQNRIDLLYSAESLIPYTDFLRHSRDINVDRGLDDTFLLSTEKIDQKVSLRVWDTKELYRRQVETTKAFNALSASLQQNYRELGMDATKMPKLSRVEKRNFTSSGQCLAVNYEMDKDN